MVEQQILDELVKNALELLEAGARSAKEGPPDAYAKLNAMLRGGAVQCVQVMFSDPLIARVLLIGGDGTVAQILELRADLVRPTWN